MKKLRLYSTLLQGLTVVERQRARDSRGFFSRFFCADELSEVGFCSPVAQINHTFTAQAGALRGLHFQYSPYAEDKFVSCLRGEVYDVAVDLRPGSKTFLQWHAEVLSADNARSLFIPKGFAHGFQTLSDNCELIYLHSQNFSPGAEGGLNARDPEIAISWPLEVTDMSDRDYNHPFITSKFTGVPL